MRLTQIWIHPVKSLAGFRVPEATVEDRGLRHDRRFMVVDPEGRFLTQRELPSMARLRAELDDGALWLVGPEGQSLEVPLDGGADEREVVVWGDRVASVDLGEAAADFLRAQLGVEARLVRMPAATRRPVDPAYARPGDLVSFADGFPFLLVNEASLAALNERLAEPVDVRRFRPNLVVDGAPPFAEDDFGELAIGPVVFHARKGCGRCQIVNVDPDRGTRGKEPLATLSTFRRRGSQVVFGQNLVHDGVGVLREGDPVVVR